MDLQTHIICTALLLGGGSFLCYVGNRILTKVEWPTMLDSFVMSFGLVFGVNAVLWGLVFLSTLAYRLF